LRIGKIRIPIGVLCCIYESRPNVTVDIAVLAIKSGNACVLRGGKEAIHTNNIFATLIREAIDRAGVPSDAVQFVSEIDRAGVPMLAELDQYIDLIIPRGGEGLVDAVTARAKMPVLRHRKGVTHMYIDREANIDHALKIVLNGKTSNPSVCNSLEKVLVDAAIAESVVPRLVEQLKSAHVEVRGCERTAALADVVPAEVEDWSTEYLDLIIAMKIVDDIDDAIDHIQTFSTGLADGIVTENYSHAWKFLTAVDSGATYVNASTRFTDGGEFGLGAEVGISTAKIHGMGPMGLEELTVTKYIVFGDGQIRE
jgi:glutamate-5-semialdehyde dehydrogenase